MVRLAVRKNRQSQDIAADHQPENLGGNQSRSPVRLLRREVVVRERVTNDFEGEEFTNRPGQTRVSQRRSDGRDEGWLELGVPNSQNGPDESFAETAAATSGDRLKHSWQSEGECDSGEEELLLVFKVMVNQGRIYSGFSCDGTH